MGCPSICATTFNQFTIIYLIPLGTQVLKTGVLEPSPKQLPQLIQLKTMHLTAKLRGDPSHKLCPLGRWGWYHLLGGTPMSLDISFKIQITLHHMARCTLMIEICQVALRVAKTCQPCQPVGANFSKLVLIFG